MEKSRYRSVILNYGQEAFDKIYSSTVLVVGAGGIGCEILKNLALTGFIKISLIDLDTIDVSNLNRQFLFRQEHVGQPKAVVAANAVLKFNHEMKIDAYHANVKDAKFDLAFFQSFSVVLNALDNVDARKHVNRLCLAAGVPLIDAGTTGYLGQVMPIFKGKTACYECTPKPTPKTYPVCTIRSTPDKPVHCIVWAKELFKLLFDGPEESMLFEDPQSGDKSTYMHLASPPDSVWTSNGHGNSSNDNKSKSAIPDSARASLVYGHSVLTAHYITEVLKRIEMGTYKTAKSPPEPVAYDTLNIALAHAQSLLSSSADYTRPSRRLGWDRQVWSPEDCAVEFLLALHELLAVVELPPPSLPLSVIQTRRGHVSFDKDFAPAMLFVCAAANLRMHCFSIPTVSYHDAKGIAGNIIPAIATTNAIVAGLQVLQAVKWVTSAHAELKGDGEDAQIGMTHFKHTYCLRAPTRQGLLLQPVQPEPPSGICYVCSTAEVTVQLDTTRCTLEGLVKRVLKGKLGFNEPTIALGDSVLYEEGSGADISLRANLPLVLNECPGGGVRDGCSLAIEDFTQELTVRVVVRHVDESVFAELGEVAAVDLFLLSGDVVTGSTRDKGKSGEEAITEAHRAGLENEDDEVAFVSEGSWAPAVHLTLEAGAANGKRSRGEATTVGEDSEVQKKLKSSCA